MIPNSLLSIKTVFDQHCMPILTWCIVNFLYQLGTLAAGETLLTRTKTSILLLVRLYIVKYVFFLFEGKAMDSGYRKCLQIFKEPQRLIYTGADGKLNVDYSLISELETLNKPLIVIAIAGLYRTGKSYLMNRLAGKTDGKSPVGAKILLVVPSKYGIISFKLRLNLLQILLLLQRFCTGCNHTK